MSTIRDPRTSAACTKSAEELLLHADMLRDLKQVNSHLVAAGAYTVLEGMGGLLPDRVRRADDC